MNDTNENNTSADDAAPRLSPAQKLMKEFERYAREHGTQPPELEIKKGISVIFSHKPNNPTTPSKKEIQPESISEEHKQYRELLDKKNEEEIEAMNKLLSTPYSKDEMIKNYQRHYQRINAHNASKGTKETEE